VHWTHLPIALAPDADGPDADGCYSGAMVVHDGVPTIVYTGVHKPDELACLAFGTDDDLETWTKFPGNPVIPATPEEIRTTIFRDHTLWREGDDWLMGVGAGIEGEGGAVLLYRSTDLREWHYLHPLATEQPELNPTGELVSLGWECPDFFFLDNDPVLIACDWDGDPISVSYWTGTYHDRRFIAERHGIVDAGPTFYAPQSFNDASGRRIMIGWLRERRANDALVEAGWAGAMSLPRTVSRLPDGTLDFAPVPEVVALRGRHVKRDLREGPADRAGIPGNACEIVVTTSEPLREPLEIELLRSVDGSERTVVRVDPRSGALTLDTTNASRDELAFGDLVKADVPGSNAGGMHLRIHIDRSVVEVCLDHQVCVSGRAYPVSETATGLKVINAGSAPGSVDLWEMRDVMS
jgi:beta-fructofuranosidase